MDTEWFRKRDQNIRLGDVIPSLLILAGLHEKIYWRFHLSSSHISQKFKVKAHFFPSTDTIKWRRKISTVLIHKAEFINEKFFQFTGLLTPDVFFLGELKIHFFEKYPAHPYASNRSFYQSPWLNYTNLSKSSTFVEADQKAFG